MTKYEISTLHSAAIRLQDLIQDLSQIEEAEGTIELLGECCELVDKAVNEAAPTT